MRTSLSLRRNFALILTLATVLGITSADAQKRKREQTPRAIAIVEIKSETEAGRARVVPVTIRTDERYFNAGLFMASPTPLALEAGNVYEVFKNGSLIGYVKLTGTRRDGEQVSGVGDWEPLGKQQAEAQKAEEKPAPIVVPGESDDERPRLRRPEEREAEEKKAAEPAPPIVDEDRPRLRRGKPQQQEEEEVQPLLAGPVLTFVGISDPGEFDRLSFSFPLNAGEQQQMSERMAEVAIAEVDKYRSARKLPKLVKATMADIQVRIFDLDTDNDSETVLTGRVPQKGGADHLVTVVGRFDYEGKPRRIFAHVTDVRRREVEPPMEFIDAADVDGDGRGDLVFRQRFGNESVYHLYRAGIDALELIYEGPAAK